MNVVPTTGGYLRVTRLHQRGIDHPPRHIENHVHMMASKDE
jgi:hypothetical protein